MKKIVVALGLSLGLAAGVQAADSAVDQLNEQIQSVLVPFQTQTTTANLTFGTIKTDENHALDMSLNGLYRKTGPNNLFEFKIDNLSYAYGDGTQPITIAKGSISTNFTKIIPQNDLNKIIPYAAEIVEGLAAGYTSYYGDAASVKGVVTSTAKDTEGNYTALTGIISAKIDLNKLPQHISSEDVIVTDAVIYLTINLKTGITYDSYIVSNPDYESFQEDQEGLKETLDKFLAGDPDEIAGFVGLFSQLDNLANDILEDSELLKLGTKLSSLFTKQIVPTRVINLKQS